MKAYRVSISLYKEFCGCNGESLIEEKYYLSKSYAESEYARQIDLLRETIIKDQKEDSDYWGTGFKEDKVNSDFSPHTYYFDLTNPYEDKMCYYIVMDEFEIEEEK